VRKTNVAAVVSAKLKNVRQALKKWNKSISKLSLLIDNCEKVLKQVDDIEQSRCLTLPESNFRKILKNILFDSSLTSNNTGRKGVQKDG
jgi:hypothetical protein